MHEINIIYGITNLGLLFLPAAMATELAAANQALLTAKTWGEFKTLVSKSIYEFYLTRSEFFEGPKEPDDGDFSQYDLPPETPFTPNDVFYEDERPAYPEMEMAEWMPLEIQGEFGRKMQYSAMDANAPAGEILILDEERMPVIVAALEHAGFTCFRDDELLMAAATLDFDPDDYPEG